MDWEVEVWSIPDNGDNAGRLEPLKKEDNRILPMHELTVLAVKCSDPRQAPQVPVPKIEYSDELEEVRPSQSDRFDPVLEQAIQEGATKVEVSALAHGQDESPVDLDVKVTEEIHEPGPATQFEEIAKPLTTPNVVGITRKLPEELKDTP